MRKQRWLTCWIPHRLELLLSPSWASRPVAVMRVTERLEIEHLRHGGLKNGHLYVSYGQFIAAGVSKRVVRPALDCAQDLGLIEIIKDEAGGGCIRPPSRYRLTYLPIGKVAPTDEWKRVAQPRADAVAAKFREATTGRQRSETIEEERFGA